MFIRDQLIELYFIVISSFAWAYAIFFTAICWVITIILYLCCLIYDPDRKTIHSFATFWAKWIVVSTPVWRVRVIGKSNIGKGPYVFVSNHQSLGDILCLYFINKQFKFVSKESLFKTPFVGWGMQLIGYIPLERGDKESAAESFRKAEHFLKNRISVMIFPEGTRSPDGKLRAFKRGAFRLAIINKVPVVPIIISGTRDAMKKGKWYFGRRAEVLISIERPIDTKDYSLKDSNLLRERVHSLMFDRLSKIIR